MKHHIAGLIAGLLLGIGGSAAAQQSSPPPSTQIKQADTQASKQRREKMREKAAEKNTEKGGGRQHSEQAPATLPVPGAFTIAYFGYLSCPDVCPATLGFLQEALQELSRTRDLSDLVVLFVSLDPKRDTQEALDAYVKHFYPSSPRAYGLRLDEQALQEITKRYGVAYKQVPLPHSKLAYSISHSSALYLFDKQGALRQKLNNLATLQEDLASFLAR